MMRGRRLTNLLIIGGVTVAMSVAVMSAAPKGGSGKGGGKNPSAASTGRLFVIDSRGGRILSLNPDGTDMKVLIENHRTGMDGLVVDTQGGHIFWANMGRVKDNDGSVERMDLDGKNLMDIVPKGGLHTGKQIKLDKKNGKLYWSDREGMRVMRSNIDGSNVETIVETAQGEEARKDARNWCVGIAVDPDKGKVYWTQKGNDHADAGTIRRVNIKLKKGETPAHRSDVEILFDGLPEPIDMDLDLSHHMMYWTDRGDAPRGNNVSRAPMDPPKGFHAKTRKDHEILTGGLKEGIGITLDLKGGRMFFTDMGGGLYSANLDGSDRKTVLTVGSLLGIAYVELPK